LLLNNILGFDVYVGIDLMRLDMPALMVIYGGAFFAISIIFVLLHVHAIGQREKLELDDMELFETYDAIWAYGICVGAAVLSMVVALLGWKDTSPWYPFISGMVYALIGPAQGVLAYFRGKQKQALKASLSGNVGF